MIIYVNRPESLTSMTSFGAEVVAARECLAAGVAAGRRGERAGQLVCALPARTAAEFRQRARWARA